MGSEMIGLELHFVIPFLPPSSNHIYVTNWRSKLRFLSQEAKVFQRRCIAEIQEQLQREASLGGIQKLNTFLDDNAVYEVECDFFFPIEELINITYGKKNGAKDRYKTLDVENRTKLLSDSLAKALGLDDKLFFKIIIGKAVKDESHPIGIEITIKRLDPRVANII